MSCVWADLDVGESKPHKCKRDALLRVFAMRPTPNVVVESGSGVHPYWLVKPREIGKER
jgi:hypothetical protein